MIACPKCGFENELGRIFCYQCGERLDLKSVKPPSEAKEFWGKVRKQERIKQGRSLGQVTWRWCRLLIFLGLLLCIGLIFAPPDVRVIVADPATQAKAREKLRGLEGALNGGQPVSVTFTEAEIDALLPQFRAEAGEVAFVSYQAETRQLEVSADKVVAVVAGKLRIGTVLSLPVVVRLAGQPKVRDGSVALDETGLYIGMLPIPRLLFPAFQFLMNRMENFWTDEELSERRAMLSRATDVRVHGDAVIINVGRAPAPGAEQEARP